ncbi:MAG: hypothetical protein IT204_09245 [Fimbriimonadaceae bacterium]|nr:hypothetical protein [Fimbriimonadaceae bacterium]
MRLLLTAAWPRTAPTFEATDEAGRVCYTAVAKLLALRDCLTIRDGSGEAVATLQAGSGGYLLTEAGHQTARVLLGRQPQLELVGRGTFVARGDLRGREYQLSDRRRVLATVSRAVLSLTDRFALDLVDPADALAAVAFVLAVERRG